VVDVKWYGTAAVELTYKDPAGKPGVILLYRDREPTLEVVEVGRPWSFDGDGKLFRLVSEAQRINLAHLLGPLDPLPHQITAVYGEMLPRHHYDFSLPTIRARRQDDHGRAADQGAFDSRGLAPLPDCVSGQPSGTVAGRAQAPVSTALRLPDE